MVDGFLLIIAKATSGGTLESFLSKILPSENSPVQKKPKKVGDFGPLRRSPNMIPNRGNLTVRRGRKDVIGFFDREVTRWPVTPSNNI